MSRKYKTWNRRKKWICPYYKYDAEKFVSCDGGRVCLFTRDHANRYMDKYCASYNWEKCSLAQYITEMEEHNEPNDNK